MGEEKKSTFSVDAGVLRFNRELDEVDPDEFAEAVCGLARSGIPAPMLDLGDVNFLPSYHIEGIRAAADECLRGGRSLTVRTKRHVGTMLERMGLAAVARLKSID